MQKVCSVLISPTNSLYCALSFPTNKVFPLSELDGQGTQPADTHHSDGATAAKLSPQHRKPDGSSQDVPQAYLQSINQLLVEKMAGSAVCFLYLPLPPGDSSQHMAYLQQLQILTDGLPPTLLVHGESLVTSTALWKSETWWRKQELQCLSAPFTSINARESDKSMLFVNKKQE